MNLFVLRFSRIVLFAALAVSVVPACAEEDVVHKWCDQLGARLHSVSSEACRAQHFEVAPERTALGNALVMRDFVAKVGKHAVGSKRILAIGGIHGDELTSVSTVFRWLSWVGQPDAARYHWRIIPVANPDGLLVRPSTRVNSHGVDINRNFQTPDWDNDAQKYWVKRTNSDPRRNPGESAGSEVETRWLQAQIEEFQPDLVISVHAPYNLLDYDGSVPEPTRFGRLHLNRLGVYPGSMGNYGGVFKQIPVITIELPHATQMPSTADQRAMWDDMLKWIKNNFSVPMPK